MKIVHGGAAVVLALTVAFYAPTGAAASPALTPATSPARPGLAPANASDTYLDQSGKVMSMNSAGSATPDSGIFGCTPGNGADNPHYTSPDVSGHGTYIYGSCTKPTAKVFNCLYEWYTDNTWRQKACSSTVTVTEGGGSGNRSNARHR